MEHRTSAGPTEQITMCVFAKPPGAGTSKTRLVPAVGAQGAAELAAAFLEDTWSGVRDLGWADPVLVTTDENAAVAPTGIDAPVWLQGPGDLGARLERVLRRALALGRPVMALGADSPGLPAAHLDGIRAALVNHDAVLGPADDGGFYALAMRRCPEGALLDLPWSAANTMQATLERLRAVGLAVGLAQPWFDVDRPEDLLRLRALIAQGTVHCPATARALLAHQSG